LRRSETDQLAFVFADSPLGSGSEEPLDVSGGKAFLLRTAKSRKIELSGALAVDMGRLLEEVASPPNLAEALLNVARNKGAPGIDGCTVEEVVGSSRSLLFLLRRALLGGRYQPGDIRRVWIPKPGGGQRGLGIPNVVDRWVQQAVLQILEPIFDPGFHDSSHGFRRHRGARTAVKEVKTHVRSGYRVVVDCDLSKFFDKVHHQRLLDRVGQQVRDTRILDLVRQMLKAHVVLPEGVRVSTEMGAPQGGPLSPLLSNIVLDELDWELDRRGLRFVRYADDFQVFVRSERAGRRVMDSTRRFIEKRLRLLVNEGKSSVSRPEDVQFLGFRFVPRDGDDVEVHISKRTKARLDSRILEMTPRNWGRSLAACLEDLNVYLRGWTGYFRLCTADGAVLFRRFDAHIRRRIRAIVVKQKKRPRHLFRHLVARGVNPRTAGTTAFRRCGIWSKSNRRGLTAAYPNIWFATRLYSLWTGWHVLNAAPRKALGQALLFDL